MGEMQPLVYGTSHPPAAPPWLVLGALPLVAGAITLFALWHNAVEEPFGIFHIMDAAVQVGGPVMAATAWFAWFWIAVRCHQFAWFVLLPVACWAVLNLWVAQWLLVSYFYEPWNG